MRERVHLADLVEAAPRAVEADRQLGAIVALGRLGAGGFEAAGRVLALGFDPGELDLRRRQALDRCGSGRAELHLLGAEAAQGAAELGGAGGVSLDATPQLGLEASRIERKDLFEARAESCEALENELAELPRFGAAGLGQGARGGRRALRGDACGCGRLRRERRESLRLGAKLGGIARVFEDSPPGGTLGGAGGGVEIAQRAPELELPGRHLADAARGQLDSFGQRLLEPCGDRRGDPERLVETLCTARDP